MFAAAVFSTMERNGRSGANSEFRHGVSQVHPFLLAAVLSNPVQRCLVGKRLHGMDEKVFQDTGKVPPSLLSEWEVKAHTAAQEKSAKELDKHRREQLMMRPGVNADEVKKMRDELFAKKSGNTEVRLRLEKPRDFSVILDVTRKVRPDKEFWAEVERICGPESVEVLAT